MLLSGTNPYRSTQWENEHSTCVLTTIDEKWSKNVQTLTLNQNLTRQRWRYLGFTLHTHNAWCTLKATLLHKDKTIHKCQGFVTKLRTSMTEPWLECFYSTSLESWENNDALLPPPQFKWSSTITHPSISWANVCSLLCKTSNRSYSIQHKRACQSTYLRGQMREEEDFWGNTEMNCVNLPFQIYSQFHLWEYCFGLQGILRIKVN